MNIQFQLCGLFILSLLVIFYKSHRTLQLYKEKVFYAAMCIILVSLSADLLSLVVIHYREFLSAFLVEAICKFYIVTLIWGSWSALIYVISDLYSEQEHRKVTMRMFWVILVQSLVIFFLPIYLFANETQVYTYGPAVLAVYGFVGVYIISTITVTIVYRRKLNSRRRFAILLWMIIWMASAVIQFINSSLLIVGFASALGVLILFVIMENPEANIERKLGCFNSYALTEYVKQLYERKRDFYVMEIYLENTGFFDEQGLDVNEGLRKILDAVKEDVLSFKNINLSLVLISDAPEKLEAAAASITDAFSDVEGFRNSVTLILASDPLAFSDMEELFRFLQFVRIRHKSAEGTELENEVLIRTDEAMIESYKSKYRIEQQIEEAMREDRVEVFLQPIFSNRADRFTSAEALVRIRQKDGQLLSPGIFIPVAEENGQILALGERVFEKVCQFLKTADAASLGLDYIEINLSVVQCEKTNLAERLISVIEKYQVDPGMINLEITETASIGARKTLLKNMEKLIAYGFTFSLDDFGKGESNLMYVVEMPVSIVKLDYDISKYFFKSVKAQQVVRAVLSMAHGMNLKVVAEGIETEEEALRMQQEGVDYIQGFHYSRPLPMAEYVDFVRAHVQKTCNPSMD